MEARARKYSSIKSIFALLTVNLLASSTAEYVHQHQHDIQSKIYVHPRFGDSSIRYCAFNQYFDDREGRCMIIPGGGIAISIDEGTTCNTEALRGHPHRPRNYYICRKSNTILADCGRGKRFENRLKRCTIDANPSIDEEDYDSHHHPYDHLHLPACQSSGRFPVPQDNCTSFYTCTSNGFRFFRSIHKCPPSTGFDPFDKICTTERACDNDELGSTTAVDDRAELFGSTIGLIVATTAGRSLDEVPSIHTPKENYSLNKPTTRFTATSASSSSSTSEYDEAKNSVSFVTPNTFTTEKITTATSLPDSIDKVVGIARATRPTTKEYEHWGETSPFASTTYVHSFGLSEETNTSERSTIAFATNQIVDTSTANTVLSNNESTVNTSGTTHGILNNKYSGDYVTLRSDNRARQGTKNESSTDTPVTISTNNKNDVFTVATNEIVDASTTNSVLQENESTANTYGTNSDQFRPLSTNNQNDEFTDKTTIDDLRTRERDETRTSDADELGIGLQVSYSTESAIDNASEKWLFDKRIEGATSTIADEIPRRQITERELGTSLPVFLSGATSDATTRDIQYKEAQLITTPSGISSIDQSSTFIEEPEIKSTPERITLYDAVTLTTPVDSYASSGEVSWKSLSSVGIGDTSISPTCDCRDEIVDSTPVTLTSLTPRSNEATSIPESNWTTEEESTIADRYHGSFSSFSTDRPDNEKSTTNGAESTMSTTEPTYITDVTEKFESTPVTLTSLTPPNDEATSIQDSNWATEEKSTIGDRYHDTFRSSSTDYPDDEKSTIDGAESTMSTIEPTYMTEVTEKFDSTTVTPNSRTPRSNEATSTTEPELISEVTEKFDSTPVAPTSLPTRNNEATSTVESEYISEVTEKFDSTPVSPILLTTRSNEATSIQDSNWTTNEESTIADRYHGTFSSFSTDTPDNEKSTTSGVELTMSTTEPTYITEVTEEFDSTPVSPTSLTTQNNEATSIQDSNWTTEEESTIADRYHGAFSSFSTDMPDYEKSTSPGTQSAMSTTEPVHISEVTEKVGTHSGIAWKSSSTEDLFTPIEQHQSTTGENSYQSFTYTENSASGAWQSDTAQTTEDSVSGMNVAVSTTSIAPSAFSEPSQLVNGQAQGSYTTLPYTFSWFSTDTPDNEKSTTAGTESEMSTAEPAHISEITKKAVTYSKIASPDDLLTTIEQHQSTTGENSYQSFTYTENSASGASQSDIAQTTEDSVSGMNVAISTTFITPSASSEPSQLVNGQAQGSYTTLPYTFSWFSTDTPVNEKSTTAGTESEMSTAEPVYISEITEKAVTYSKITSPDDLLTTIEQYQSSTGEKPYPAFTYTGTFGASHFGTAQTTEDSNPEMNVALSTTSIIPSLSSEPSQLQDGQARASYTSASNSSEYQTTVEPLASSTNS